MFEAKGVQLQNSSLPARPVRAHRIAIPSCANARIGSVIKFSLANNRRGNRM